MVVIIQELSNEEEEEDKIEWKLFFVLTGHSSHSVMTTTTRPTDHLVLSQVSAAIELP